MTVSKSKKKTILRVQLRSTHRKQINEQWNKGQKYATYNPLDSHPVCLSSTRRIKETKWAKTQKKKESQIADYMLYTARPVKQHSIDRWMDGCFTFPNTLLCACMHAHPTFVQFSEALEISPGGHIVWALDYTTGLATSVSSVIIPLEEDDPHTRTQRMHFASFWPYILCCFSLICHRIVERQVWLS